MSNYQQKDGEGSLFPNVKQNDRQPDWRGTVTISGKQYVLAGWARTTQGGKQYVSLKAEEPRDNQQQAQQIQKQDASRSLEPQKEDLPF